MMLQEAQARLNEAQARLTQWLVKNTDVVVPDEYMRPVRDLSRLVAQLEKEAKKR